MDKNGTSVVIEWTPDKLRRFKKAFKDATKYTTFKTFFFDGNEFFSDYAKHLIAYLEERLKK